MGIERTETVVATYVCDRCDTAEEVVAERYAQALPKHEWIFVSIDTVPSSAQHLDRVLCASCKTQLQAWFQAVTV
jgi:hypothetical protein